MIINVFGRKHVVTGGMGESNLQMVCVLPWSVKDEDWQVWSTKFHMCAMYKGYDSTMDDTVTLPTADELFKEIDAEDAKSIELMIKLNRPGYVDLKHSMSDVK